MTEILVTQKDKMDRRARFGIDDHGLNHPLYTLAFSSFYHELREYMLVKNSYFACYTWVTLVNQHFSSKVVHAGFLKTTSVPHTSFPMPTSISLIKLLKKRV